MYISLKIIFIHKYVSYIYIYIYIYIIFSSCKKQTVQPALVISFDKNVYKIIDIDFLILEVAISKTSQCQLLLLAIIVCGSKKKAVN